MNRPIVIGLGAVTLIAVGVFAALRFGAGPAARTGLDAALENLPPGWEATHGAVTYDALSGNAAVNNLVLTQNGTMVFTCASIAANGIAGMTASSPPAHIDSFTLTDCSGPHIRHLSKLVLSGANIENLRKLFDKRAYPGGKPESDAMLPIASGLDGKDIDVHIDIPPRAGNTAPQTRISAVDLHIGGLHYGAVSLRQFAAVPEFGRTMTDQEKWQFISALALGLSVGPTQVTDITETIPHIGVIRIASVSTKAYSGGKSAGEDVDGISADLDIAAKTPLRGTMALHHLELRDIDSSKLLAALPVIMASPAHPALQGSYTIGSYAVDGVSFDFARQPLYTLASLSGSQVSDANATLNTTLTMRGFKITTTGRDISPAMHAGLQLFGMEDFNTDMDIAGSFNRAAGRLIAQRADITLHGLGALRMAWDVGGITPPPADAGPGHAAERAQWFSQMQIYSATLRWDDASLTDRLFHLAAVSKHQSEQALRDQLAIPVASLALLMPEQPDAPAQINAFLQGHHHVQIDIRPPHAPVSIAQVTAAGAAEKAPLLGVTVKGD